MEGRDVFSDQFASYIDCLHPSQGLAVCARHEEMAGSQLAGLFSSRFDASQDPSWKPMTLYSNHCFLSSDLISEHQNRVVGAFPSIGASSLPPGRYFRIHVVGYFEGINSERGIVRRCSDGSPLRPQICPGYVEMRPKRAANRDQVGG
jgi:hypothetical protein